MNRRVRRVAVFQGGKETFRYGQNTSNQTSASGRAQTSTNSKQVAQQVFLTLPSIESLHRQ